jgi:DNA-binding response OmpR family regulator
MNILLVDDEQQLTQALAAILKQHKYSVDCTSNGEEGLEFAKSGIYDLIILDVMMPKVDGFTMLKNMRQLSINTPVLMLSAKSEITDKIKGLNLGADDYITKPFHSEELLARIKALLRREGKFTGDYLTYKDIMLNKNTFELTKGEKKVQLGKKEYQILELLMINKGNCIEKEHFIEKIWGFDTNAEYNTIEVYVSFLRKKLALVGSDTEIKSIRGVGYMFGERK